jgi:hypothetical protein
VKRKLRLGLLAVALPLVMSAVGVSPRKAEAACFCPANGTQYTIACWGKGSTCAAAQAALLPDCQWRASAECLNGACAVTVTSMSACGPDGMGNIQVDGFATYKCLGCGPGGGGGGGGGV